MLSMNAFIDTLFLNFVRHFTAMPIMCIDLLYKHRVTICCANQIVINVSFLDWLALYKRLMFPLGISINILVTKHLFLAVNQRTTTDSSISSTISCDLRYLLCVNYICIIIFIINNQTRFTSPLISKTTLYKLGDIL